MNLKRIHNSFVHDVLRRSAVPSDTLASVGMRPHEGTASWWSCSAYDHTLPSREVTNSRRHTGANSALHHSLPLQRHRPDRAKNSYEAKLVSLLQELDRSVTLVTMEEMEPRPQGWTHVEHTYRYVEGGCFMKHIDCSSLVFSLISSVLRRW